MNDFTESIRNQVMKIGLSNGTPSDEKDVLRVLFERWGNGGNKITQKELATALPHLGGHPKHDRRAEDTTLRRVRQIIRDLRTARWAPILSDIDGYWLPHTEEECREYMNRIEGEIRARVAASFETYRAMKGSLGISSAYLDGQERLMV